jgi:hypothetical protein
MVLLKRHWWLLWITWALMVLAGLVVPDERVQIGASLLMLVALGIVARWYVRHGPGPYRQRPSRE